MDFPVFDRKIPGHIPIIGKTNICIKIQYLKIKQPGQGRKTNKYWIFQYL